MSIESLMSATHRLSASMDALAALGAELRLRRQGTSCASEMRTLLREAVHQIDPKAFDDITADQEMTALAIIDAFFRQAADLLESPSRPPGWSYTDPAILNGQGFTSRRFVWEFARLALKRPDLAAMLARPGHCWMVGPARGGSPLKQREPGQNGGWLVSINGRRRSASRATMLLPAVLGIASSCGSRPSNIWTTTMRSRSLGFGRAFLSPQVVTVALERVLRALVPGGWLVFGLYAPPPGPGGELSIS